MALTPPGQTLAPVLMTFFAAILWGLWWIPIRYLEGLGLSEGQVAIAGNLGAMLATAFYLILTRQMPRLDRRALCGAVLVGVAVSSYSIAIVLTDVMRAVLLFYLAPAWSKIIEWAFLGQRWRHSSTLTLLLSLCGAFLVLGGEVSVSQIGPGDILAIVSGIAWAIGAALVFTGGAAHAMSVTLATMTSATLVAAGYMLAIGDSLPQAGMMPAIGLSLALGAFFVLPVMALTMWSAQRLTPALLSFLFTLEILSGVISGAFLLDEVFGVVQLLGAILIVGAALVEVAIALRARPRHAPGLL
ncbi:EamA family transporter [Pseudohalocynthiibacter aestuariivivens]|uniref:DMT family transporter n=1 Tax=Roseovarius pelagicus TaxID=2980108 RepID=A0ABY6DFP4_9RHOB|nr:DMT family transporter [Roseovarius pelagicus]QIE46791.1 EamA family transporter [Pseudohalocynthiibacter aestuariivivens]UXX84669.1 DMT family transporter [Roseovarius pelagicus]